MGKDFQQGSCSRQPRFRSKTWDNEFPIISPIDNLPGGAAEKYRNLVPPQVSLPAERTLEPHIKTL